MRRSKEDAVRLFFSVISSEMTRGNRHETQEFPFKHDKKLFTVRAIKQQYRLPKEAVELRQGIRFPGVPFS